VRKCFPRGACLPLPVAMTLTVILMLGLGLASCAPSGFAAPPEPVRLGLTSSLEPALPFLVAENQRFFATNGLNVTLKPYDSGLAATNAMMNGEVDVAAGVSEYVLVGEALDGAPVKTLAVFDEADVIQLLARPDRGIQAVADLRGKRVGVIRGTNLEFFLGRFLTLHGIGSAEVSLVDVGSMQQGADWLAQGRVDALPAIEPYVHALQTQLGDKVVAWPAQSGQPAYQLVLAGSDWVDSHPRTVERLLRAIGQAEGYIAQHPDAARALARSKQGLSEDALAGLLSRHAFTLSLDMALVTAMEDEARWMIQSKLTTAGHVPDMTQWIYPDGLQSIKPDAVDLIR
jgi:ABC-type nitrate/sulfonate/bicarbonate transport system substrate-binding protein